jgi:uncharacterized membrane protein YkoI
MKIRKVVVGTVLLALAAAAGAAPPATYERDVPDALAKDAKVSEESACTAALSRVGGGEVVSLELEREHGKLIYSVDVKLAGKPGVEEVEVNAIDGSVIGVEHEADRDGK